MSLTNYIKEVKTEMSHVSWPTKRQTFLFTVFVIVLSFGVAFYLGLFDYLFKMGLERIINQ